jgi:hypothetical protein
MNFFKRLFGGKETASSEPPPEFLQASAPDWVIDLKGRMAEMSPVFSIRAQVYQSPRKGAAEIIILPREPDGEPRSAAVELERLELDRLFVVLGFSFPEDFASVTGEKGTALKMMIYRRGPYTERAVDCDLSGWLDSRKSAPPVMEIGRIMLELRRRTLPEN